MPKELKKLMKRNDLKLIRQKGHAIWKHKSGALITTSISPSCIHAIKNIKKDIKKTLGCVR